MEEKIKKSLPFIALAGAGLALVFTFLIGVSATAEDLEGFYIYHFFDGGYISGVSALEGAPKSAMTAVLVLGMIVTILGLIAVLAFAGITAYIAVRKYVYKQEIEVERFSLYTYLSYVTFAALFYALNCTAVKGEVLTASVNYNAATIAGLTLTSVAFCGYYVLKIYLNRNYFKEKTNITKVAFTFLRIALLATVAGLVTAPILKSDVNGEIINANFGQILSVGAVSPDPERVSSLISASAVGFVLLAATVILSAALISNNIRGVLLQKKSDTMFYIIAFAVVAVMLIFAALSVGFYSDIAADGISSVISMNLTETQSLRTTRESGGFRILLSIVEPGTELVQDAVTGEMVEREIEIVTNMAAINLALPLPLAAAIVALVTPVLTAAYPALVNLTEKLFVKKAADEQETAFLEVKNLNKYFPVETDFFGKPVKFLKAVDGVSFSLKKGKTLGIVGESGCGKTTLGRTILRLYDVTGGDVWFKGEKISALKNSEFDKLRPQMQMIFQDPYASLSPRLTVGEIIGEAAKQHKIVDKEHYREYVLDVMKMCGLQPHYYERYPHEFSGGQRQRICIARALALKPELVVCDEPVSALDVSIQAQIINMLIELRKTLGLTYVFISHDLSVVKHISDEVGVMYLGSLVEYGSKEAIFENTLHPYTKALFSAVPVPNPHVKMNRIILKGDIPSPVNPPKGCKFHTRCDSCMEMCGRLKPIYKEVEPGHFCACHLYNTEEETKRLEEEYAKQLEEEKLAQEDVKADAFGAMKNAFAKIMKKTRGKSEKPEAAQNSGQADTVTGEEENDAPEE